ncbi:MAG: glycosyltransferase family 2 protein [Candidatus Aureabacteria bacterium]|nr:glycosyltransferase family 2 protein [Candidatus Auribacterota bacterium]
MADSGQTVDLSIIMPALNEEGDIESALRRTLESFVRFGVRGEVVVVNDGSTDSTPRRVEEMMAKEGKGRVRMIRHETPRGVGASFRDGLREAKGEVVAFMPGDDENDPSEIIRYLPLMKEVDLVVPFVFNRSVRAPARNLLSLLYRTIVNLSFGVNFNYTNGTVLYRRSLLAARPNTSDGFFFQTENVVRAARKGYLCAEVPYRLDARRGGGSKAVSWKSLQAVSRDFLRLFGEIRGGRGGKAGLAPDSVSAKRKTTSAPDCSE